MLYVTFRAQIEIESQEVPLECEVECSANLSPDHEIEDIVIDSIFSMGMDRYISGNEISDKQMQRLFDKALKKFRKQYEKIEYVQRYDEYDDDYNHYPNRRK